MRRRTNFYVFRLWECIGLTSLPLHAHASFAEIAQAFKQLQAEKRTLEKIVRATTPLDGIGDGEGLGKYLENVANKLDLNAAEIRKLLDLLDRECLGEVLGSCLRRVRS